jgi:hypothetical protein
MLVLLVPPHSSRWSTTSGHNVNSSNNSSNSVEDLKQQAYDDALQWQQLQKEMGSLLSNHQLIRTSTIKRNSKQRQQKWNTFSREFEALKQRFGINRAATTDTDTTTVFNLTAVNTCDDDHADHMAGSKHNSYNNGPETASVSPASDRNSLCARQSAVGTAITGKACSPRRSKPWKPNCRAQLQWTTAAASDSISGIAQYIIADTAMPRCKSYTTLQRQSCSSSSQQLLEQSLSTCSRGPRLSVTSTPSTDSADAAAAAASVAARRDSFTSIHKPKQAAGVNDSRSARRRLSRSSSKQLDNDYTDISCASRSALQLPESAVHHVELPLITGSITDDNSSSVIMMAY